ncbi:MAG: DNA-binding protein [Chthoniobacteraceae bacterium]
MINNQEHSERQFTEPLASEKIVVDRKVFYLDLRENARGRYLKITEDVAGRRDTILLPAEAFRDFVEAAGRLIDFEQTLRQ